MVTGKSNHVVIIGAGFAGLEAAKQLSQRKVHVTLIDRHNHHLFQPLLYQVATAGLSPADIAMPVRSVLTHTPHTEILMAEVEKIDVDARTVRLDRDEIVTFDWLLVATGARHSYFGNDAWEQWAPGLKTLEDAIEIRRRILIAFEEAERARTPEDRNALLTFVVIGGGPTGIEMAGAIAETARFALARDFDRINPRLARIELIEAGARLLPSFHADLGEKARQRLTALGVHVRLETRVSHVDHQGVSFGQEMLPARTVIWAAGVEPSPLARQLGVPLDRGGKVLVTPDLSIPGHPNIFVAGDLAHVPWKDGLTVPGMAPGAMQQGRHVARNILRLIEGKPTRPFCYLDKGSMATIGRSAAVVELGRLRIEGFIAWLIWIFVHIYYLIGFRNRFLVMFQWAWFYFTFQRGTRLITGGIRSILKPKA